MIDQMEHIVVSEATLGGANPPPSPLSPSAFLAWLESRQARGESASAIGRSLGVTHTAVAQWLGLQRNPSRTVLLLAARLASEPSGLPGGLGGLVVR